MFLHQNTKQSVFKRKQFVLLWSSFIGWLHAGTMWAISVFSNKNLLLFSVCNRRSSISFLCLCVTYTSPQYGWRENWQIFLEKPSKINKKRERHTWNKSHWQKAINETLKGPCCSSMCVASGSVMWDTAGRSQNSPLLPQYCTIQSNYHHRHSTFTVSRRLPLVIY